MLIYICDKYCISHIMLIRTHADKKGCIWNFCSSLSLTKQKTYNHLCKRERGLHFGLGNETEAATFSNIFVWRKFYWENERVKKRTTKWHKGKYGILHCVCKCITFYEYRKCNAFSLSYMSQCMIGKVRPNCQASFRLQYWFCIRTKNFVFILLKNLLFNYSTINVRNLDAKLISI